MYKLKGIGGGGNLPTTTRTREERTFDYLNSRIHTRETSTLTFTTVTASASLLLLGILMGMENPTIIILSLYPSFLTVPVNLQPLAPGILCNIIYYLYTNFQNSNILLNIIGILIIVLGIFYREATIFTIDIGDYDFLKERISAPQRNRKRFGVIRSIIIRAFFIIILGAWFIYIYPSPLCIILVTVIAVIYIALFTWGEDCAQRRDCRDNVKRRIRRLDC